MTGNQLISAYTEIARDDYFPVLAISSTGVDSTFALTYLNIASRRVMRSLRRQVKASFSFVPGTQTYSLLTATSSKIFEVFKVKGNNSEIPRTSIDDTSTNGYYIVGDNITFLNTYATAVTVILYGYAYASTIVASDATITDIPEDLHLALVQLAIVESCGSHEATPDQLLRLNSMRIKAEDAISRQSMRDGMNTFPSSLTNGKK